MKKQRGLALSGLIVWGIVIALVAIFGMRVLPSYLDYYKTVKAIKAVVAQAGPDASVAELRQAYNKYFITDSLTLVGNDLDISKREGRIVIEFGYEKRIPLLGNASLVIDYHGTSAD